MFSRKTFYVIKPIATCLVIALAIAGLSQSSRWYQVEIVAALACCLCGDIFLLGANERWFAAGLASFLAAHVLFIVAFVHGLHHVALPWWSILIALYGLVLGAFLLRYVTQRLKMAVALYCVVITLAALAAAWRWHSLHSASALLALSGALIFMISDSLLGVRYFVTSFRYGHVAIMASYWLAIVLLALSA
jgi:uncharacterized membrane protein YhhN